MVFFVPKFNLAIEIGHKVIKTWKKKNFNNEAFLAECWEQKLTEIDGTDFLLSNWSKIL